MKRSLLVLALIVVGGVAYSMFAGPKNQALSEFAAENHPEPSLKKTAPQIAIVPVALNDFSPAVQTKIKVLQEILLTKNDNDPRLDSEFQELTPELKEALVKTYKSLQKESLNERGTVVFLLGKDIKTDADLEFFQDVLTESPCLSLSDCGSQAKLGAPDEDHLLEAQETTLLYPQIMATRLLVGQYQQSKQPEMKEKIQQVLSTGSQTSSDYLSQEMARISLEAGIKLGP